ncbi:hypothetical protein EVAR_90156_1 [Eumeta japonica]|uniref:Uncharacterized protein n=1 Tax=Eumeta variegata TaxID=151549 RepID=A0A4C1Z8I8_EUMVA|nr:hypothetical protein EVAR_90156_1 [Eumeta japonica]
MLWCCQRNDCIQRSWTLQRIGAGRSRDNLASDRSEQAALVANKYSQPPMSPYCAAGKSNKNTIFDGGERVGLYVTSLSTQSVECTASRSESTPARVRVSLLVKVTNIPAPAPRRCGQVGVPRLMYRSRHLQDYLPPLRGTCIFAN